MVSKQWRLIAVLRAEARVRKVLDWFVASLAQVASFAPVVSVW